MTAIEDSLLSSLKDVTDKLWSLVKDEHDDPAVGIEGWNEFKNSVAQARYLIQFVESGDVNDH